MAVLLTAYATAETAVEALEAGAFRLEKKPFDLDEIALLVRSALDARRRATA
jgi:two-component system response regulator PilR (NtrC family)